MSEIPELPDESGEMERSASTSVPEIPRWPAEPDSAWAEAVLSPLPFGRLNDPPEIDSADATSIADWIEDQRRLLPTLAIVCAAVGVILIGGLLLGVFPRSGPGETPTSAKWAGGIGLLVVSTVLLLWEGLLRRKRRGRPQPEIPQVRIVLCELRPTTFAIHDGDGYRETCIALDANTPDLQAARLLTAFWTWLDRLHADPDAASLARNEAWSPSGASVFASEEIFGSEAAGGYLVRRPNLPANGWGLLITPRRPAKLVGQLRFATVLQWKGTGWGL